MDEKDILRRHTIFISTGGPMQCISLDAFTAICDNVLLKKVCRLLAQSSSNALTYAGRRNKTTFLLQIIPFED